jgi:hypothetical protein
MIPAITLRPVQKRTVQLYDAVEPFSTSIRFASARNKIPLLCDQSKRQSLHGRLQRQGLTVCTVGFFLVTICKAMHDAQL